MPGMMIVLDAIVVGLEGHLAIGGVDPERQPVALERIALLHIPVDAAEHLPRPGVPPMFDQHEAADQRLFLRP